MNNYISVQSLLSGTPHYQVPALSLPYLKTIPSQGTSFHFWTANLPKDASLPRHTCSNLTEIAIGKPLKLSPAFPPLHTGHATFTASGVPSIKQIS